MITPQFVGQRYKDTNTGNIWIANSTTPGDWTLEVQDAKLLWEPKSSLITESVGFFTYGDLPGITSITCGATSILAGLDLETFSTLQELHFPNLVSIDPTNSQGGYFNLPDATSLTVLDLPVLATCAGTFWVAGCNALTSLTLPLFAQEGINVGIALNTSMVNISLPSLAVVGGQLQFNGSASLTTISIPSLSSLGGNFLAQNCALSVTTVNGILHQLVSIAAYGAGKTVNLSGGTSAAPSGQGIVDKATLIGRGATVTTN